MKAALLLLAIVACALANTPAPTPNVDYQNEFTDWMQANKKSYHHDEFSMRFNIWKRNHQAISAHNAASNSYTMAMNKFGDLTNQEFVQIYNGAKFMAKGPMKTSPVRALPTSWDWRTKGAVTAIKNQGQCGSCWSFSTTGSTEGCHFLAAKKLVSLSEQNLMDCSNSEGNQGCNGGLMTQAFQYILDNSGIDTEASYPYTAEDGPSCQYTVANRGATIKSYVNVSQGDENDLQAKVYTGPTSVAIDASQNSFQFYSTGVYVEPQCSSTELDHGVLAVGWGVDTKGGPYWIVKNSWGTDWGQSGYIWMARNLNNQCGIATMASIPKC
jgi:cathepsin L